MSSAQLDIRNHPPQEATGPGFESAFFASRESPLLVEPELKHQVAARLAFHRARRQRLHVASEVPTLIPSPSRARAARIAAAVAERYANTQSYRAFLAAQAEAAAKVDPPATTQLNQLSEIPAQFEQPNVASLSPELAPSDSIQQPPAMTVRLYEETPSILASSLEQSLTVAVHSSLEPLDVEGLDQTRDHTQDQDEVLALDREIAFRQSPHFEDIVPPTDIPANLIEFPRQLIAARRARPRLAEGPLREYDLTEEMTQLRIFEVEPSQLSSAAAAATAAPEWTSIMLDAQPIVASTLVEAVEPDTYPTLTDAPPLQTAPLELRIMAAAVDSCIVLVVMLAFATAAVLTIGTLPPMQLDWPASLSTIPDFLGHLLPGALIVTAVFIALTAIYQTLFFTFSDSTPGMNYARISLCTFSDDNPTRAQMRRRVLAFLVSVCPLGLGLLWSWIDTDRLGWHDRLSRMYQRSY